MNKIIRVILVSFITNLGLSVSKIIFGILFKSNALIVDGIHSLSDLVTDVVVIFGSKIASKPADLNHPYGHGKLEYMISILIGTIIIILGLGIIFKVNNSEIIIPSILVVVVSFFTIIIKLSLSRYVLSKGKQYKNNLLVASGKESMTDVISSVVVLVSVLLMQLSHYSKYFIYADRVASIIVGIFIIKVGFDTVKDNISTIIGEQETDKEYIDEIRKIILNDSDIKEIKQLILLKYGTYYKLIGELAMDESLSLMEAHSKIDIIEENIINYSDKIAYINIHMCPYMEKD